MDGLWSRVEHWATYPHMFIGELCVTSERKPKPKAWKTKIKFIIYAK